ncbi:MAG: MFS transporter [Gammaproteobacteria bacterium]|nr:MFS transporter [Gammaproteobacteria bacterium]
MASANPLHNQSFRKLFMAQVIALLGTGLSTVGLTLLAYEMAGGNAAAVLGTALAFKMLAYVFFAPIIGGLAHRFARKPLLITMDICRALIIVAIPLVSELWQIYLLIFSLNLFSAGFTPVIAATIPEILPEQRQYTRALSMSRLAYDLESLLSPLLAGVALLFMSYSGLFVANSIAFGISAGLILVTALPPVADVDRPGNLWHQISFGVRAYLRTPRLRGLLALYLGVASASAMVIVNTVVYVREYLGGSEFDVAMALGAAGLGSMLAALAVPRILERVSDRGVMLSGSVAMAAGLLLVAGGPGYYAMLAVWFLVGLGWSLVQTPAGRVVNRSSSNSDRSAYFSAQFALSHACWLLFYLVAGQLGSSLGVEFTALLLAINVAVCAVIAAMIWPRSDREVLMHTHPETSHEHLHYHDLHHDHEHEGWEGPEPHSHPHRHRSLRHAHRYVIDDHHAIWPGSS